MLSFTTHNNFVHNSLERRVGGVEFKFGISLREVEDKPKPWILMLWDERFSGWKKFSCVISYFCYRIDDEVDDTEVEETQEEKIKVECEHMPKKVRLSWHIDKTAQ